MAYDEPLPLERLQDIERKAAKRKEYLREYSRTKGAATSRRLRAEARDEKKITGVPTLFNIRTNLHTGRYIAKTRCFVPCNTKAEEVLAAYTGACDICGRGPSGPRGLHIDHDHATGVFRGWLCSGCNTGVGAFRDDPSMLERAAAYLKTQFAKQIV